MQDDRDHALNVEVYRTTGMVKVESGLPEKEPEQHTLFIGKGGKTLKSGKGKQSR